jgi:nucleoside 2-deoxyribosyltransferase
LKETDSNLSWKHQLTCRQKTAVIASHKTRGCRIDKESNDMFGQNLNTTAKAVDIAHFVCQESGAVRSTVSVSPRNLSTFGVYIGHPISGIRVSRLLKMQRDIIAEFERLNSGTDRLIDLYFPMRTTHLHQDDVGASEYEKDASLFSNTRHFTLQNRQDALFNADAVLINFEIKDDAGEYRLSKGIPFDYGWAAECGKPVIAVISPENPNRTAALDRVAFVTKDLSEAISHINDCLPAYRPLAAAPRVAVEIFDFTNCSEPLSMIAELARADARKYRGNGAAIISILPEGRNAPAWHGQVLEVSDWILANKEEAETVVRQLLAL